MRFGYVILYVPDVARAVEFYERAFGLSRRFVHESGSYAEMETGQTALAFVAEEVVDGFDMPYRRVRREDAPPGVEIALVTDEVDAAFDRAVAAGAQAVVRPLDKPWGQRVSYVRDENGHLVEICSPMSGGGVAWSRERISGSTTSS
jgi:lactoylglutathione lyase